MIIKKTNPIDVVLKDKAKFDVQNPILGSLVAQAQENKTNQKAILNQLIGAPSTKDIELANHLAKLRGETNNNDNNNNFPPFVSPLPLPPTPPPSPPDGDDGERDDDNDDDDDNKNLTSTQRSSQSTSKNWSCSRYK